MMTNMDSLFDLPEAIPPHPCPYSWELLQHIKEMARPYAKILDMFAGRGERLLMIRPDAYLNEIEPEWAQVSQALTKRSYIGDALHLQWEDGFFDAIVTSPTYANRMADHHNAKDGSKRFTYRHSLGRPLHPNNSGQLDWKEPYRDFYRYAWNEAHRVTRTGGGLILNIKDHYRKGEVQPVTAWHVGYLRTLDFVEIERREVEVPSVGFGKNAELRVEFESLIHFRLEKS